MAQQPITLDDFTYRVVEGTTASVADTSALFRHASNKVPRDWSALEGDVYIPYGGLGPNTIDVRSRLPSHKFRIILFF